MIAHQEVAPSRAKTRFVPTHYSGQCPNVVQSDLILSHNEDEGCHSESPIALHAKHLSRNKGERHSRAGGNPEGGGE